MEPQTVTLEARLAALELEVQSLRSELRRRSGPRHGVWAVAATAGLALFLGAALPAVTDEPGTRLKAPFTVVDEVGRPLFEVRKDKDGPVARVLNAEGGTAVLLWADAAGGNLNVKNAAGKSIGELTSRDDGAGGDLSVYDKSGKIVGSVFARDDGAGGEISVSGTSGKSVAAMYARPDGAGGDFGVYDRNGDSVAAMFARKDGSGGNVVIYHRGGKPASTLFAQDGQPVLQMYTPDGRLVLKQP